MPTDEANRDPIMEEVYAVRRTISEECAHDIHRLFEMMRAIRRKEEEAGIVRQYVRLPIARVAPAEPAYPSAPEGTGLLFACEPKSPAP